MGKLLLLVLTGVILFNLGGVSESKQTIPEKEGRRIAIGIGKQFDNFVFYELATSKTTGKNRAIHRVLENKNKRIIGGRERNKRTNPQTFQTSTITPKPRPPKQVEKELVYKYADKYGIMRIALWKMVLAESGGNIYAYNEAGNYWGLLQWRNDYYINQARVYGYKWPNVFDPDEHLDVSCRAISEGQAEMRWPKNYHFLTAYYTDI